MGVVFIYPYYGRQFGPLRDNECGQRESQSGNSENHCPCRTRG